MMLAASNLEVVSIQVEETENPGASQEKYY
jgi:hypothetical protein